MSGFNYEKDSAGIATVTIDLAGPVNTLGKQYDEAIGPTLETLEAETDLAGVIFTSAKRTYIVGADLDMISSQQSGDESVFFDFVVRNKECFRRLERLPVPVVAAINGAAMGGGFEFCLACNHRVAWDDTSVQLALPEIKLGFLPGAGGVVRLVNLLGFEKAMPYLLKGKQVSPAQALADGLIHQTVENLDDLVPRARTWILENKDNPEAATQPWDRKGHNIPGGDISHPRMAPLVIAAPQNLFKETRGLIPAAERILEIMVEAITTDIDTALLVETRKFMTLLTSPVSKNMLNAFFFNLNALKAGLSRPAKIPAARVSRVGIIGAGMMGQGIAYVSAKARCDVALKDVSVEAAEKGRHYSAMLMDREIRRGRSDEAEKRDLLGRIRVTDKDEDLAGCDLIIEAVFEDIALKDRVLQDAEACLAEGGIWGSNTSTLPITRLAQTSARPENVIGLHFASPVDRMPAVEIVCGEKTSDETLAKAYDYVTLLRKTPVVVNDGVGFYTSRVIAGQLTEGAQMVAEGLHPVRVDNLSKAIGMAVGPLTLYDEVSLKTTNQIRETQLKMGLIKEQDDPRPEATALLRALEKEHGRGGRRYNGGFYEYGEQSKEIWPQLLRLYYRPEINATVSDKDIRDRLLFSNVIAALECLQEGILRTVAEGNIASIMMTGAPAWTGGYLQFVNTYGLRRFMDRCDELVSVYGERFKAPAIVAGKLAAGETFQ